MKKLAKCALIRSVRTMCQTAVATIGTSVTMGEVNWILVGSASFVAGIVSFLMAIIAGLPEVDC